jgi:hypothetical protein
MVWMGSQQMAKMTMTTNTILITLFLFLMLSADARPPKDKQVESPRKSCFMFHATSQSYLSVVNTLKSLFGCSN